MTRYCRSTSGTARRVAWVFVLFSMITLSSYSQADKDPVFARWGVAIKGYDTVAYHLEQQPVKGSSEFTAPWNGATWRFKNAANRDRFIANPERWAPRYGGYCAWAVSNNYTAGTDPEAWSIVNNRLYLNYSVRVRETWARDTQGNIRRADANWPTVLTQ